MFIETDKKYIHEDKPPLPFVLYTIGRALSQPAVNRPAGYEGNQILCIEKGSGIFTVDGKTMVLNEGDGFFFF